MTNQPFLFTCDGWLYEKIQKWGCQAGSQWVGGKEGGKMESCIRMCIPLSYKLLVVWEWK